MMKMEAEKLVVLFKQVRFAVCSQLSYIYAESHETMLVSQCVAITAP
jgi:hypothetical protein